MLYGSSKKSDRLAFDAPCCLAALIFLSQNLIQQLLATWSSSLTQFWS